MKDPIHRLLKYKQLRSPGNGNIKSYVAHKIITLEIIYSTFVKHHGRSYEIRLTWHTNSIILGKPYQMEDQNLSCVVSQHPTYPQRPLKMPNVSSFVNVLLPVKTVKELRNLMFIVFCYSKFIEIHSNIAKFDDKKPDIILNFTLYTHERLVANCRARRALWECFPGDCYLRRTSRVICPPGCFSWRRIFNRSWIDRSLWHTLLIIKKICVCEQSQEQSTN